jgi:VanZ family protein
MKVLRNQWVAWGLLVCWACAIWYGSTISLGSESPFQLFGLDKAGHAVEFGILAYLAAHALLLTGGIGRWGGWQGAVLLAGLWGWIDEVHQLWVPGRTTDPSDLLADIVGAAIGAWICLKLTRPRPEGRESKT